MTRTKIAAISTLAAAMILGSTLVFAATPAADSTGAGADAPSVTTDLQADPPRRGGGGGGGTLKK